MSNKMIEMPRIAVEVLEKIDNCGVHFKFQDMFTRLS